MSAKNKKQIYRLPEEAFTSEADDPRKVSACGGYTKKVASPTNTVHKLFNLIKMLADNSEYREKPMNW